MSESFIVIDEKTQLVTLGIDEEHCSSCLLGVSNYGRTSRPARLSIPLPSSFIKTSAPYGLSEHDVNHVKYSVAGAVFPDGTQIIEEDFDPYSETDRFFTYEFGCGSSDPDLLASAFDTGLPIPAIPRYSIVAPDGRTIASHVIGIVPLDDTLSVGRFLPPVAEHTVTVQEYDDDLGITKGVEKLIHGLTSDMSYRLVHHSPTDLTLVTICGPSFSVYRMKFCCFNEMDWEGGDTPDASRDKSWDLVHPRWHYFGYGGGYRNRDQAEMAMSEYDLEPSDWETFPEGLIPSYPEHNSATHLGQSGLFGGEGNYKYNEAKVALRRISFSVSDIQRSLFGLPLIDLTTKETLTKHSLSDFRFISVNMLEFVRDLRELKGALKPLVDLWHKPLSPKSWANLWLSARFGLRLTLKDAEKIRLDIVRKIRRNKGELAFQTSRSRQSEQHAEARGVISVERHQKMYFRPSDSRLRSVIEMIYATGFYPTPLAVWELIPYSFVVDWVLPVSKYLEQWDRRLEEGMARYRLLYVQYSTKAVYTPRGSAVQSTILYRATGKRYRRWHESSFPGTAHSNPLSLEVSGDIVNIVDAVSLIVQRGRGK